MRNLPVKTTSENEPNYLMLTALNTTHRRSDSGFGGASSYGSSCSHTSSMKKDSDGNDSPRKLDLDGLTPFEKNFYVESQAVAAMTEAEVEEYRKLREITVVEILPNLSRVFVMLAFLIMFWKRLRRLV